MIEYKCNVCDIICKKKDHYNKHINTKKHKNNLDNCIERLKEKNNEIERIKLENKNETEKLKVIIESKDELINKFTNNPSINYYINNNNNNCNNSNNNTNIKNNQNYLSCYYPNNPPLNKLEDYSVIKDSKYSESDFVGELCSYYSRKQLASYLGKFLIKKYKKDDLSKQSLFNTDLSRYSFLISKYDQEIDSIDWIRDGVGNDVTRIIIDPLLDYIKSIVKRQHVKYCKEVKNDPKKLNLMTNSFDIINDINREHNLRKGILAYISPYLVLSKKDKKILNNKTTKRNNNELLEDIEQINDDEVELDDDSEE